MSEEKIEKYPQIILETDGTYRIYIAKGVRVRFDSKEELEDFVKDKNFVMIGKKHNVYDWPKKLPY